MKRKYKIIIFVVVIIVVLATIFLVYGINKKVKEVNNGKVDNNIDNTANTTIDNTNSIENELSNTANNVNENTVDQNNVSNENSNNTDTSNNTNNGNDQNGNSGQETNVTDNPEEKAINIVKKDWGTDNDVYFSFDGIDSNGRYIVGVRDKATTYVKYWYDVDLKTETFTMRSQ